MAADEEDAFLTLEGHGQDAFEVAGSRFLGHAAPARTVEAAEAFVSKVGEAHPDATHVVPAYRVRDGATGLLREYASDEGEPSGSAGKPILTVLAGRELENVVVAVVRYYGGTNLGVGGLARAYGRAATGAIEAAGVVEAVPRVRLEIRIGYDDSGTVRGILESEGLEVTGDYGERVRLEVWVPRAAAATLRDRLQSATSGRAEIERAEG